MKIPFIGNSPIRKNMTANLFGVCVQLLNQIALVPFYILFWGNELYCDWIVISALTTIFSMSDVGLNNVIQNRFAIKFTEGNIEECKTLITNNYVIILGTLIISIICVVAFICLFDIVEVMNLHALTRNIASFIFILLLIKVFIGMLSGVQDAVYRATHNSSVATYINQIGLLATSLITMGCVMFNINLVLLCILITLPQLYLIVFKFYHSKKFFAYKFSLKQLNFSLIKEIILPSISFMSFPIGNAIVLQGFTIVVNNYFGANSVVLYNTTRTLCNFIKTFVATIQNAVWPEYTIAYGNKNYALMRHLHRKVIKVTLLVSITMGCSLILFGPIIYKIWTKGVVVFQYSLMITYVVVLITESLWTSSAVTLMSTNNHSKLGLVYIESSLLSLLIAIFVGNYYPHLWALAGSLVILHIIMIAFAIPFGFKITQDKVFKTSKNISI